MLILFGTKGRESVIDSGTFFCPQCRDHKHYEHKKLRLWFTLYFIPLFPYKTMGEFIQCGSCGGQFKPEVLNIKVRDIREEPELQFNDALVKVMVRVMTVGPETSDAQVAEICRVFNKLCRHQLNRETVMKLAGSSWSTWDSTRKSLEDLGTKIKDEQKDLIIRAAVMTARADGKFDSSEEGIIEQTALSLGYDREQLDDLLGPDRPSSHVYSVPE